MCVLFHLGREIAVDHDFVQLVPTRPDVVHKNLVRGEGIFNGRLCEVGLFQLDSVSQLVHRLNPQVSLKIFTCEVLSNNELDISFRGKYSLAAISNSINGTFFGRNVQDFQQNIRLFSCSNCFTTSL